MRKERIPSAREVYVSVDIEAAGPVPGIYSMLALGACVVGGGKKEFYSEIRPINHAFVPAAIKVSGLSLERLQKVGRDPKDVMEAFGNWVGKLTSDGSRPVFVGFNSSFDWAFVNWYFHRFVGENPFGIGGVDIKAYYMGFAGCPWADTSSSRLPAPFQFDQPLTHNALEDARAQAGIFDKLLQASKRRAK